MAKNNIEIGGGWFVSNINCGRLSLNGQKKMSRELGWLFHKILTVSLYVIRPTIEECARIKFT